MKQTERRRHPRLIKNLPLKIRTGEFDCVTETANVSCAGTYCRVDHYLAPMSKLKLVMLLPLPSRTGITLKKVSCEGVVVRVERIVKAIPPWEYNIAIFFNNIKEVERKKIAEYVEAHLAAQRQANSPLGIQQ